jgi:hypothetical protein
MYRNTDVKHHLQEMLLTQEIKIVYKPTSDIIVDILTKPLYEAKHVLCTEWNGVKVPEMLE